MNGSVTHVPNVILSLNSKTAYICFFDIFCLDENFIFIVLLFIIKTKID
jgi:hypothetical protein